MSNSVSGHVIGISHLHRKHDEFALSLHKKYRSHFELVALILDALKYGNEDKYSLMKHTGINYVQLKKYLNSLAEVGLIDTYAEENNASYRTNEKGRAFLWHYCKLSQMLLSAEAAYIALETKEEVHNRQSSLQPIMQRIK